MAMSPEPARNRDIAVQLIRQAAQQGAQIICLPELYHTPYFCKLQDTAYFDYAEPTDGPSVACLQAVARDLGVVIIAPYFEARAAGITYNSAAVIDADGSLLGQYRKQHIPQDPGFEEKFYFTPGDNGFRVWQTRYGRIGVLICWDQWFPEAARLTAMRGADLLLYPTAIGWLPSEKAELGEAQHTAWETVQRGHAVANGCYLAAINRIGTEALNPAAEPTQFWGQSFVSDCYGQCLHRMGHSESGVAVIDCDLTKLQAFRRIWPFFRDRRIDAYDGLNQRWLEQT